MNLQAGEAFEEDGFVLPDLSNGAAEDGALRSFTDSLIAL